MTGHPAFFDFANVTVYNVVVPVVVLVVVSIGAVVVLEVAAGCCWAS